jgi:Na+-transporting NADH:ubiquinone oxidoreductase subunit NqrB
MAARSKAGSVAVRVLELAVQIPPGARIGFLVSAVCCQVLWSLRRADHLCRGVLLTVLCLSMIVRTR